MKAQHILAAAVLILAAAGAARGADLVLQGNEHRDVTTGYDTGVLWDSSTADIVSADGHIETAYVNDTARLRVQPLSVWGASGVSTAYVYNAGQVEVSNGIVSNLWAYDTSTVGISGGSVGNLRAYETSTMDISGGSVSNRVYAHDTSAVGISGGSVSSLYAYEASTVDISGGTVVGLRAFNTSIITLHGYDFRAGGGLSLVGDELVGTGPLTGKWFDGTPWAITIDAHDPTATILAVPEPATLSLLVLGLLGLAARPRRCGRALALLLGVAMLLAVPVVSQAVEIETVPVRNAGNGPDTRYETPGYGAVEYEYRIGKYEVTAGQYTAFLNAVAVTDTYGLYNTSMATDYGCRIQQSSYPGNYAYSVASDWANRPVNYVSWGDAARFTNWLTNGQPTGMQGPGTTETGSYTLNGAMTDDALWAVTRNSVAGGGRYYIPTEDEWYKAAYYNPATSSYYAYPTASNSEPSNVLGSPTDPGNNATFYSGGYTIGSPYYRTEVGAHENSDSPYGTFDQGGNVWEWNETAIGTSMGSYRGLRGGAFYQSGSSSNLRASYRSYNIPTWEDYCCGFRVSEVPEPATLSLLALGLVGLVKSRRRSC